MRVEDMTLEEAKLFRAERSLCINRLKGYKQSNLMTPAEAKHRLKLTRDFISKNKVLIAKIEKLKN